MKFNYKITMSEFFRIEREYGYNLFAGDGKEDYANALKKFRDFYDKTYSPFIEKLKNKKQHSEEQLNYFLNLKEEYDTLERVINYERVKYYSLIFSFFTDLEIPEIEDISYDDLIEFIDDYEKKTQQYFMPQVKETDGDVEKKQKALDGLSLTQSIKTFLHGKIWKQ